MTYKQFKEKFDKTKRKELFWTFMGMRIKELWGIFLTTSFMRHISFLWHWKNFFFCLKYPFWKARNVWSGKFMGYTHTWYDDIPEGWKIAFGKNLSKDILKAGRQTRKRLEKHVSWEDMLSFQQIKEKWGVLCLYASASKEIQEVLDYYEHLSQGYCICCGKPARYITKGWVSFQCENCFVKNDCYTYKDGNKVPLEGEALEKHKQECRLTKKDIPSIYTYDYKLIKTEMFSNEEDCNRKYEALWDNPNRPEGEIYIKLLDVAIEYKQSIKQEVSLKEKYGIDFEQLWDL